MLNLQNAWDDEDKLNDGQKKLDAMVTKFHKDYGIGGYSDHYTCPTN